MRLDNRDELREQLRAAPDMSDADLMLRAYERWGLEMPHHPLVISRCMHVSSVCCARATGGAADTFYRVDSQGIGRGIRDSPAAAGPERAAGAGRRPHSIGAAAGEHAAECAGAGARLLRGIRSQMPGHQLVVTRSPLQVDRSARLEPPAPIRYNARRSTSNSSASCFSPR